MDRNQRYALPLLVGVAGLAYLWMKHRDRFDASRLSDATRDRWHMLEDKFGELKDRLLASGGGSDDLSSRFHDLETQKDDLIKQFKALRKRSDKQYDELSKRLDHTLENLMDQLDRLEENARGAFGKKAA
jgi:chromosome segregation ATPase